MFAGFFYQYYFSLKSMMFSNYPQGRLYLYDDDY